MQQQITHNYHPVPELKEVISSGEEKFEKIRSTAGLVLGPLLFFIMLSIPVPELSTEAHT